MQLGEIWRRGGIRTVVVEWEVRVGERWYVSCFQRVFTIRKNRECLCVFREDSNRVPLVARIVAGTPHISKIVKDIFAGTTIRRAMTGRLATQMSRTERVLSRETSCDGEHLEIWDLLEGCHRSHQHLTYARQCNGAENLGRDTPACDLCLPCAHR